MKLAIIAKRSSLRPRRDTFPPECITTIRPIAFTARSFGAAVALSAPMCQVFSVLERFASTDASVMLLGETGTGKDVLARSVHQRSARAARPFVVFDCASVTAGLAESELLGHEKGSFTGAVNAHHGAFERAAGGTLFLDEIGELPLELQPKLLRALEAGQIRRVGGSQERLCNVRVIAATNRDLRAEVANGRFREDLYFRLATAVVAVPPLRERIEDLEILVPTLLSELGRAQLTLSSEAFKLLSQYHWPGNIRELRNVLSYALAFVDDDALRIERHHLRVGSSLTQAKGQDLDALPLGGRSLASIERAAITQTLAQLRGNKAHAAETLGIALSTLYEKIKRHGIATV